MILLLSEIREPNTAAVIDRLNAHGVEWLRVNGEDFPKRASVEFNSSSESQLTLNGKSIQLSTVKGVWDRRIGNPEIDESLTPDQKKFALGELSALREAIIYFSNPDARWMNNIFNEYRCNNVFYQQNLARKLGFEIPKTVVTQNKSVALDFINSGKAIVKRIKKARPYINGMGVIYTREVTIDDIKNGELEIFPTLFQQMIDRKYEYRVTVVGNKVFPAVADPERMNSASLDIRKDFGEIYYYPCKLPECIEDSILKFMNLSGLAYGAFDLIESKSGEFYFIEVNPGGQWGWIECETGLEITEEIAKYLIGI